MEEFMNRSQTRKFRSLAKKKGVSHSLAEMYISMRNRGSAPQDLHDGDLVRLKGELVEVKDNNLVWTSSLAPGGVGDGACEVFRVHSIQWIERQKI